MIARPVRPRDPELTRALIVVGLVTLARILALALARIDLSEDETQYWAWAQTLDFGYFSKPPLIAWVIWLTTHIAGDTPFGVRLAAPLLHGGTSLVIFAIARALYDARTGFWAALTFVTIPAVTLSSGLISTDAPLVFCWAVALYALVRLLKAPTLPMTLLLGVALGVGLLAKYAMVYFVLCAGFAALVIPRMRPLLRSRSVAIAGGIALLIVSPNLLWNAQHAFSTFGHTVANANLGGKLFNPKKLGEFIGGQFGVFGPILFGTLLVGVERQTRAGAIDGRDHAKRLLLSFSLPVLGAACIIAIVSRANANWAAPAYVAATPLVVYWLRAPGRGWLLTASLALHATVALVIPLGMTVPQLADGLGFSNGLKRVRGWSELGSRIAALSKSEPYTSILTEEREMMGELLFYARPRTMPVVMWDWDWRPRNHYELTMRIGPETGRRVLLVSRVDQPNYILSRFAYSEPLGSITIPLDAKRKRTVYLFALEGLKPQEEEP